MLKVGQPKELEESGLAEAEKMKMESPIELKETSHPELERKPKM